MGNRSRAHSSSRPQRLRLVVGLPGLVILAADDQHVAAMFHRLHADVVVILEGVPVQGPRHRVARDACADRIGQIGGLLGVDGHKVVDGRIGGHHDGTGGDHGSGLRLDLRPAPAIDLRGVSPRVDRPTPPGEGFRKAGEVLEGVELPLAREAEATPGIEGRERRTSHHLDVLQSGPMRGLELLVQQLPGLPGRQEQVAVDAEEVAVDPFVVRDRLDPVDGRGVALGGKPGPVLAVDLLDLDVAVIDGVGQVGGRALRLSAGDGAVIQHDDALALAGEQVGRGQPGDPRADDADVRLHILRQGLMPRDRGGLHPDRLRRFADRFRHHSLSAAGHNRHQGPGQGLPVPAALRTNR